MQWIDIKEKLPNSENPDKATPVVMIDMEAGLSPVIGWYDPSEKGGGFYFRDAHRAVRVICTHYFELPNRPS